MSLRKIVAFALFLICTASVWATPNQTAHWNVRSDGSDSNGGLFDPSVSAPGTDYSNQAAAQVSFTDIVIGGTTSTFTSSAHPATTAYPGNGIQITGGSGCTTGWYEILSQSSGTYTVDRALGTAASTCTGSLGGGLLTIPTALGQANGNWQTVFLKNGTYTLTSPVTLSNAVLEGYNTAYGDYGTRPVITVSGTSSLFNVGSAVMVLVDVELEGNTTAGPCIYPTNHGGSLYMFDVYATGCGSGGTDGGGVVDETDDAEDDWGAILIYNSWFVNNAGGVIVGDSSNNGITMVLANNYFEGNAFDVNPHNGGSGAFIHATGNVFANETSTTVPAVQITNGGYEFFINNTFYNAAHTALSLNSNTICLQNNIFYGNFRAIASASQLYIPGCSETNAYGSNANANTGLTPSTLADITLTANPFSNPSSDNFALNATAGGGTLLLNAGFPSAYGPSTTTYISVGAIQAQISGGGGGGTGGGTTPSVSGWTR
jgi:hypothetical protein